MAILKECGGNVKIYAETNPKERKKGGGERKRVTGVGSLPILCSEVTGEMEQFP
jgi:hypothetical protein